MMSRFDSSEDFSNFFRENGYAIISDLFSRKELGKVRSDIFTLFETRFKDINPKGLYGNRLLTYYYVKEKEIWRQCAKHTFEQLSVFSLTTKPKVKKILKKISLKKPMVLFCPEVRIDMPHDRQYIQPWHQDWRYGQGSLNSVTIWVPLHSVLVENGTIDIIPRSHLLGVFNTAGDRIVGRWDSTL